MPLPSVEKHSQKSARQQAGHEAIATAAYYKWVDAGRPEGRDKDFWFQAEAEHTISEVRITEIEDEVMSPALARFIENNLGAMC